MKDLVKVLGALSDKRQVHYAVNFMASKGMLDEFTDWLKVNATPEEKDEYNFDLVMDTTNTKVDF